MFDLKKKLEMLKNNRANAANPGIPEQTITPTNNVSGTPPTQVTTPDATVIAADKEPIIPTVNVDIPPPDIKIKISSDNMAVYVRCKPFNEQQEVPVADILKLLEISRVTNGIQYESINEFCTKRLFYTELVAAKGLHSVNGADATITCFYNTDSSVKLQEDEAGLVDYRELNSIQTVKTGAILATLTPEADGIPGLDVFGDLTVAKQGKPLELKFGENCALSEDGLNIVSLVDGSIQINSGIVAVTEVFTLNHDVDSSVGNLKSPGSIVINGDVREGFTVRAEKDIVIKGMVEGAHIIAGGSVSISNGMNGMNIGTIVAEGDIVSKYFENTHITSNAGSVYSDVILNSTTCAHQSVILKGSKASLIGGNCTVGKMIYASCIGAKTNVPTAISIESTEFRQIIVPDTEGLRRKLDLETELAHIEMEKVNLDQKIQALSADLADPASKFVLKKNMTDRTELVSKITRHKAEIASLTVDDSTVGDYKIVALKMAFSGVKINMAYLYMTLEDDYSNTKFFVSDHKITAGQVLPSDRLQ